ncbi:MAG: carboxypeptidase regulatory-like domain-containing protein [Chloroflexi bacterium]|nr:carboxypeptidase regulatory-like domain-containing protein [Chloroflexota bacterium]
MPFIPKRYNDGFLNREQTILARTQNARDNYGVRVVEADVAEGETYWKVVGVHHLLPDENRSNHHVFLEALDENGQRIKPIAWADFTWEGRQPGQIAGPVQLDKPDNEAAGNIALHDGQKATVWMRGLSRDAQDKSDRVENLDIVHPDEPGPQGELWNTIGHHSFYVVFQRIRKEGTGTTSPGVVSEQVSQNGVINGQIINGRRYTVRILQGSTVVAEQVADSNGAFRFEGLPNGVYQLEAIGPTLAAGPIRLDADQPQATINLAV